MNLYRDAHRLYEEYDMLLKTNGIVSDLNIKHTLSQYTDVEGMERDIYLVASMEPQFTL